MCFQYAYASNLRLKSKHRNIVTFIPIDPVSLCVCQINAKQKHPGCKKVRSQSEAALQIGTYVRPKTLISVEAKKLLIRNIFN